MSLVMGILNVTPDSFSDGGQHDAFDAAVAHGLDLARRGAAVVDVGGESTRPGSVRVAEDEELRRVVPVVRELAARGVRVSVDTTRASVAAAAVEAGAVIVNDVSGGLADPAMPATVAGTGADYVVMHWRGHSDHMQELAHYDDVVAEVSAELLARRDAAVAAGVPAERIILDPGIGFAKTAEHNWELLRHVDHFQGLGHRVLWGVSRKGFLGAATGRELPADRDVATAALSFWCAAAGAWGVRTHDVEGQLDAVAVARHLARSGG